MSFATRLTRLIDAFYIAPVRLLMPLQTFRYGVCGGITVVLDWLFYYLIYHFVVSEHDVHLGFATISPHIFSLIAVFPITTFNGFWLQGHISFKGSPLGHGRQLGRYLLTAFGALAINYLLLKLFVEVCGIWATPSKILTTAVAIAYSYSMQKYFTFRGNRPE